MELHLEVKVVGKGAKGRTSCGSSAYRACSKMVDNNGEIHDYRSKREHVAGGVELPEGASEELRDPQVLWSRHEEKDRRKDAELFREVVPILPNELSYEAAERVLRGIAAKATEHGMCVQWDLHDKYTYKCIDDDTAVDAPWKMDPYKEYQEVRNLHGHMMLTMRELAPDGKSFGKKNRSWNKYNGGLNLPEILRPVAAELMNRELQAIEAAKRVEHESYAARGIEKIPQEHMGPAATAMERKGISTEKGRRNRYIEWLNEIHAENMQQFEEHVGKKTLQDLIDNAQKISQGGQKSDGNVVFKGWDALWAMLRDTRRCRAALRNEIGKFDKIITAYEKGDTGYLRWAGCHPGSGEVEEMERLMLRSQRDSLNAKILELNIIEDCLLNCKEVFNRHNEVQYTANKIEWDEYMLDRKKKDLKAIVERTRKLDRYMSRCRNSLSIMDTIFKTQAWRDYQVKMDRLEQARVAAQEQHGKTLEAIRQGKQSLKQHKAELKEAKKDLKEIQKAEKRESRKIDRDER